ncbi:hypothetical protein cand_015320 [Cryptosporidium andersoni]|uniref:Transmembrane protein n=1 Tax=Cryptosporidium andersoni TaxID=117008 RepID=A0A1J4MX97_9CRYT|nr:hypothetical protein cand_015320 [Cryptosporidium andersoni]
MVYDTDSNFKQHTSDLKKLSLVIFALFDLVYCGVLIYSYRSVCDAPLKSWLIGAILLSIPATKVISVIESTFGHGFAVIGEISLFVASFLWFTLGTVWVNTSLVCQSTAPALWWTVFITVSTVWFFVAGLAFSLIGITVYHMIITGGANPEFRGNRKPDL